MQLPDTSVKFLNCHNNFISAYKISKNRKRQLRESLHRQRRSLDTEVTVQLLVVVDKEMISFHGNQSVEEYVLTVMNMVNEQFLINNFDLDKERPP